MWEWEPAHLIEHTEQYLHAFKGIMCCMLGGVVLHLGISAAYTNDFFTFYGINGGDI